MNEVDRWIYFGGPAPASVRPLLDSLRAGEAAPPGVEVKARVIEDFLANFEERVACSSEEGEADRRRSDVYAVRPAPPAPALAAEMARRRTAKAGATGLREEATAVREEAAENEVPAPESTGTQAPSRLRGTAEAIELPAAVREAMGRLPFLAPSQAPATPATGIARTLQVRAMPSVGETLPLGNDAIQKAVAAVPFAGSTGGAAVVAFPELTVQQLVSLRADLRGPPDRVSETLRRYGVPNEAAWRALEAYWEERFARSAELRAERDAAVERYARWLRGE